LLSRPLAFCPCQVARMTRRSFPSLRSVWTSIRSFPLEARPSARSRSRLVVSVTGLRRRKARLPGRGVR
jgi:hypothetical protein